MAWNAMEYRCGHTERVQLYGPNRLREQQVARAATQLCPVCYREEREKQNADLADRVESEASLPTLTGGSPSQLNWARAIRAGAVGILEQIAGDESIGNAEVSHAQIVVFCKRILKQSDTKYWIDHREKFAVKDRLAYYIAQRIAEDTAKEAGKKALGLGGAQPCKQS